MLHIHFLEQQFLPTLILYLFFWDVIIVIKKSSIIWISYLFFLMLDLILCHFLYFLFDVCIQVHATFIITLFWNNCLNGFQFRRFALFFRLLRLYNFSFDDFNLGLFTFQNWFKFEIGCTRMFDFWLIFIWIFMWIFLRSLICNKLNWYLFLFFLLISIFKSQK